MNCSPSIVVLILTLVSSTVFAQSDELKEQATQWEKKWAVEQIAVRKLEGLGRLYTERLVPEELRELVAEEKQKFVVGIDLSGYDLPEQTLSQAFEVTSMLYILEKLGSC